MGRAPLGPFDLADSFLRRVSSRGAARDGVVQPRAFQAREGEESLSFTFQNWSLKSEAALVQYQARKVLPRGDLPAICKLTFDDLTVALEPALPPRPHLDPEDEEYGHLHCLTSLPTSKTHQENMAKLATRNGILRDFVRASRGKR